MALRVNASAASFEQQRGGAIALDPAAARPDSRIAKWDNSFAVRVHSRPDVTDGSVPNVTIGSPSMSANAQPIPFPIRQPR